MVTNLLSLHSKSDGLNIFHLIYQKNGTKSNLLEEDWIMLWDNRQLSPIELEKKNPINYWYEMIPNLPAIITSGRQINRANN